MELTGYNFIDTSIIMDLKQPKSLKDCLAMLLNADIQSEGTAHSSLIDARATLAIFHFFMQEPQPLKGLMLAQPWVYAFNRGSQYILQYCVDLVTEMDLQISMDHARRRKMRRGRKAKAPGQATEYKENLLPNDADEDEEDSSVAALGQIRIPRVIHSMEQVELLEDDVLYAVNIEELNKTIAESVSQMLMKLFPQGQQQSASSDQPHIVQPKYFHHTRPTTAAVEEEKSSKD